MTESTIIHELEIMTKKVTVEPILHYALGLRLCKGCEQKCEKNAIVLRNYPMYSVI